MACRQIDETCEKQHPNPDVLFTCPHCEGFVLIQPKALQPGRRARLAYEVTAVVVAMVIAAVLFRATGSIWPAYLFMVLGLLQLYAFLFSRATTSTAAAWSLAALAAVWLTTSVSIDVLNLNLSLTSGARAAARAATLAAWALGTVTFYLIGRRYALSGIRLAARYFLAVGAFTCGYWGVWVIFLLNELTSPGDYQLAVVLGAIVPLVSFAFLLRRTKDQDSFSKNLIVTLLVLAAYLGMVAYLIQALAFVLGTFVPRLVGVATFGSLDVGWFAQANQIGLLASVLFLLVAVALIVGQSAVDATTSLYERAPAWLRRKMDETRKPASDRSRAAHVESQPEPGTTLRATYSLYVAGAWIIATLKLIVLSILSVLDRAFRLVVPVFAFSAASLMLLVVLATSRTYNLYGAFFDPVGLWGLAVTAMALALVLGGLALGFAPRSPRPPGQPWRPSVKTGSVAIMAMFYLLATIVGLVLALVWYTGRRLDADLALGLPPLAPGRVFVVNAIALGITVALLIVVALTVRPPGASQARWWQMLGGRYSFVRGAPIALLVLVAAVLSLGPLRQIYEVMAGPDRPGAGQAVRDAVPTSFASSCAIDTVLVPAIHASLRCGSTRNIDDVSYHVFASTNELSQWHQGITSGHGVRAGSGDCSVGWGVEGAYTRGQAHGRATCYVTDAGAWVVWTDETSNILCIAHQADGAVAPLRQAWRDGSLDPVNRGEHT